MLLPPLRLQDPSALSTREILPAPQDGDSALAFTGSFGLIHPRKSDAHLRMGWCVLLLSRLRDPSALSARENPTRASGWG